MIAENLDQAYTNFDPARPLPGVSEFYIKREKNPLDKMKRGLLRDSLIPPKFLLSGQRGTGKSTELNRLIAYPEIQERFFIVHYSIRDTLDPAGLHYIDLLLSIGAQIFIRAVDAGLKLRAGVLRKLARWMEATALIEAKGFETELELEGFFAKLLAGLRVQYSIRNEMRRNLEPRLSEFIAITDLMVAEIELKTARNVLVAIDDLDKPDLAVVRELFHERLASLTSPHCSIIYTIPIALLYSSEAAQIIQAFSGSWVLPNVTIAGHADRAPNEAGRGAMREFVAKRMSLDLIDQDAMEHAITMSGGLFREMGRIVRSAADHAIGRGAEKIEKRDVAEAESEIRNEFRRMLEPEDYETLAKIHRDQELRGAEIFAKLLHNMSVLEYQNDENWCDVHPAIIPLIEREENDPPG